MELTINIDKANFGATLEQVFDSLTEYDKHNLAEKCMLEVMRKPNGAEREAYEAELCQTIVDQRCNDNYSPVKTVEAARASSYFRDGMRGYQSSQDKMISLIVTSAVSHYKELVTELVAKDEKLAEMYAAMREQLIKDFPAMVQAALVHQFAGTMSSIGQTIQNQQMLNLTTGNTIKRLSDTLQAQGIRTGL